MNLINKIARTPPADVALLGEAFFLLVISRLALKTLPLRVLSRHFKKPPSTMRSADQDLVKRVRWAVVAAGSRTSFEFVCFPQAIAAQSMLRRRGVSTTMYYGVARDREGILEAHVWLRVGGVNVVGGERAANFRVLKTFPEIADKTHREGVGSHAIS